MLSKHKSAGFLHKSVVVKPLIAMYPFNKVQQEDGSWIFELDGINIIMDGFFVKDSRHHLKNPKKAIAFFSNEGNLYGISNLSHTKQSAEELYDVMFQQYSYFNTAPISDAFFRQYGFVLENNDWSIELTDNHGDLNHLSYHPSAGWYYNDMLLKHQPDNVGDLMHFYTEKTGEVLKKVV